MALTATIYNLRIDLADIDRSVYEKLDVCIARHPSEAMEYMVMRVLAYCLEYRDGIELTQGVAAGNEPAVLIRDLTGRVTAWIEVGMPDPHRLHRGLKLAGRAQPTVGVVFTTYNRPHDLARVRGARPMASTSSRRGRNGGIPHHLPRTPPVSTTRMACSTVRSVSDTRLRGM